MLIMRRILDPMKQVLEHMLSCAGDLATTKRLNSLVAASRFGEVSAPLAASQWPLLIAAEGLLEKEAVQKIEAVHSVELYLPIEDRDKTVATNHLVFRLLSRQGALIHQRDDSAPTVPLQISSSLGRPLGG